MTEPTIIRASSLSTYPVCQRSSAAKMFRREVEAAGYTLRHLGRGIAALIGTANHWAAAVGYREKAQSGSLPPANVVTDAARDSLVTELAAGEIQYDGSRGFTHSAREAEHQTLRMVTSYHRVIAPTVQPLAVEEKYEAALEDGTLTLTGHPDIIAREPSAIRDLKTGTRGQPGSFAPQVGAYALLARSHNLDIEQAKIDFVRRVAAGKAQPDPITVEIPIAAAETAAANILKHIAQDLRTFRHGDPERRIMPGDSWSFLANPSSYLCSERYCPAWGVTGPHAFCNEWVPK